MSGALCPGVILHKVQDGLVELLRVLQEHHMSQIQEFVEAAITIHQIPIVPPHFDPPGMAGLSAQHSRRGMSILERVSV